MSDTFTRDRFRWWDTLAADPEMSPGTFIVGYAIATKLQRNSGNRTLVSASNDPADVVSEAWIGADAIAKKIGMSTGTVFANVKKLEKHGYIQIDPGKPGSGHSHHYRLVDKGQPADHSKGQSEKKKGQRAEYSDKPKGQPADMNPLLPLKKTIEEEPIEEAGAPQARPATDSLGKSSIGGPESLNSTLGTIVDDSGVGCRPPPPDHQARWQGKVIDQDGVEFKPTPPYERRPAPKTWMDAAFEGYTEGRS
jgi:biotin operon repressor